MKFKYVFIVCFFYILSVASVYAEYYKWIDQSGTVHYTDDISTIPKDKRPDLDVYKGIETDKNKNIEKDSVKQNSITAESLVVKKDELDNEYDAILKKKQALVEKQKDIGQKKYNVLVEKLNLEIQEYQKKVKAYEKLVEQYNEQALQPGSE